jgi:omega-amidase
LRVRDFKTSAKLYLPYQFWILFIIIHRMTKISISLAQMHIELAQPDANLEQAIGFIKQASARHSDLILFPELWSSGYDLKHASRYIPVNASILEILSGLACSEKIAIGGSMLEEIDGQFFNTFYVISDDGKVLAKYRKIHLFRLMNEDRWLQAGNQSQMVDFIWGKAGMAICYDLRFPELFRHYALADARLVCLPSEWPAKRINHWKVLLQARAIENQMFIAAVNSAGLTGTETFGGASAIVSPWGELLAEGDSQVEALLTAEIDFDEVERVRQTIPIFQDRRPELYRLSGS